MLATKARRYVFSSTRRFKLARKNDELYRVAARKHEDLSNKITCLNTLTPMWRDEEEHLIELHGKADVKLEITNQIIELPSDHLEIVSFRDRVKRIKDENKFVNDENDTLHDSNNEKFLSYRSAESEDLYSSRHQTGVTSGALAMPPKEPKWLKKEPFHMKIEDMGVMMTTTIERYYQDPAFKDQGTFGCPKCPSDQIKNRIRFDRGQEDKHVIHKTSFEKFKEDPDNPRVANVYSYPPTNKLSQFIMLEFSAEDEENPRFLIFTGRFTPEDD
ncbi:hypothetical protein DER44DRAFT_829456 [Fusarium oxysporum]|nr:hypothetical protein DER44DRAFT_829456 [Fusarium oxysporum]